MGFLSGFFNSKKSENIELDVCKPFRELLDESFPLIIKGVLWHQIENLDKTKKLMSMQAQKDLQSLYMKMSPQDLYLNAIQDFIDGLHRKYFVDVTWNCCVIKDEADPMKIQRASRLYALALLQQMPLVESFIESNLINKDRDSVPIKTMKVNLVNIQVLATSNQKIEIVKYGVSYFQWMLKSADEKTQDFFVTAYELSKSLAINYDAKVFPPDQAENSMDAIVSAMMDTV